MKTFSERLNPKTTYELMDEVPEVVISADALAKMQLFVDTCADEIGWMGTAERDGEFILIHDVFLFRQEVHATTTEITPDGLAEFAQELLNLKNGLEIWNNLRVWGHSHVNMGVSASGQDDKQMDSFADGGHDWFIRIIANKRSELKVDMWDYKSRIIYEDLPWTAMYDSEQDKIVEEIKRLQTVLVRKKDALVNDYKDVVTAEIKDKVSKLSFWSNKDKKKDNKKTEETKHLSYIDALEDDTEYQFVFANALETSADVATYFDQHDLLEMSYWVKTREDLIEALKTEGYERFFSDHDLTLILSEIFMAGNSSYGHYY